MKNENSWPNNFFTFLSTGNISACTIRKAISLLKNVEAFLFVESPRVVGWEVKENKICKFNLNNDSTAIFCVDNVTTQCPNGTIADPANVQPVCIPDPCFQFPIKCPPGLVPTPVSGKCKCLPCPAKKCPNNMIWNPKTCSCICQQSQICKLLERWDPKLCKCVPYCEGIIMKCPKGYYWDTVTCKCVSCKVPKNCGINYTWSVTSCSCVPLNPCLGYTSQLISNYDTHTCTCKVVPVFNPQPLPDDVAEIRKGWKVEINVECFGLLDRYNLFWI